MLNICLVSFGGPSVLGSMEVGVFFGVTDGFAVEPNVSESAEHSRGEMGHQNTRRRRLTPVPTVIGKGRRE